MILEAEQLRAAAANGPPKARRSPHSDNYEREERVALGAEEVAVPTRPTYRSPAEIAKALASVGPRLPTSLATLNEASRGGIPSGRRIFVIGPPGSGKTGLLTQEIRHQAEQGHAAGYLVADGDANDVVVRIGQQLGFDRELLEAADPAALRDLAARFVELPWLMIFDHEDGWTIETAAEELHRRAEGRPTWLGVDSIQTIESAQSKEATSPRDRIDAVIRALKAASKKYGHRILATSEAGRSAYRFSDSTNRSEDIAAGKESSSIEYAADVLLVARSVKGEQDLFEVSMPKNRLGRKAPFRLKLSYRLATFTEAPMPEDDSAATGAEQSEERRAERAKTRVLGAIREHTDLTSMSAVSRKARGNKQENLDAIRELTEEGRIAKVGGVFRLVILPQEGGEPC